jgi:hypothetical protein
VARARTAAADSSRAARRDRVLSMRDSPKGGEEGTASAGAAGNDGRAAYVRWVTIQG